MINTRLAAQWNKKWNYSDKFYMMCDSGNAVVMANSSYKEWWETHNDEKLVGLVGPLRDGIADHLHGIKLDKYNRGWQECQLPSSVASINARVYVKAIWDVEPSCCFSKIRQWWNSDTSGAYVGSVCLVEYEVESAHIPDVDLLQSKLNEHTGIDVRPLRDALDNVSSIFA